MKTTVINIYHGHDYDVYIGRAGYGYDGYFGNPFTDGTRTQNIEQFKQYVIERVNSDEKFRERVKDLYGKTLGCFCKPKPCHGDILVELSNKLHIEDELFEKGDLE